MSTNGHLEFLEHAGLVQRVQIQPELEYLFRHALMQEAAYESLLKRERKRLHLAVGEVLERLYPDRLDDLAPVLARHFADGGQDQQALAYFTRAGDVAVRVYANAEAVMHYRRALEIAKRRLAVAEPAEGEARAAFAHLYGALGHALELSARYTEAVANYRDMETFARLQGDRAMEFEALMAQAKIHATVHAQHDAVLARTLLDQALALTWVTRDRVAEAKVLWNLMLHGIFGGGDLGQALVYGEQSLALARELDLREQLAFTLNDIQYAYEATGHAAQAIAALNEARDLWRELGNLPMLADNLANLSIRQFQAGDYEQAICSAEESYAIARSIDNVFGQVTSRFMLGSVYFERGQPGQAIGIMEEVLRAAEQVGHPPALVATRAELAWVYGTLGAAARD